MFTAIEALWEENNRIRSTNYQLRAWGECQKLSMTILKRTFISCRQRADCAENQTQDIVRVGELWRGWMHNPVCLLCWLLRTLSHRSLLNSMGQQKWLSPFAGRDGPYYLEINKEDSRRAVVFEESELVLLKICLCFFSHYFKTNKKGHNSAHLRYGSANSAVRRKSIVF